MKPEDLWKYVDKSGADDCWPWTRGLRNGYGRFRDDAGKTRSAHVEAFIQTHGSLKDVALKVLHSCDNPCCCNPRHLRAGTQAENVKDRDERGRRNIRGERNSKAKLTEDKVRFILAAPQTASSAELARIVGVSASSVRAVRCRTIWSHVKELAA